jgi:hypothetical protein
MAPLDFNAPTKEEEAAIARRKAAITRRVRKEVLAELGIDKLPSQGERTLITGAQGTGKSRSAAEAIAELPPGAAIWWLVPTIEKAQEQVAEYTRRAQSDSMQARVVRGRGAEDPAAQSETMCPRHLVVNRAAAMGVNVQKHICENGCPLCASCGFQRQKNEMPGAGLFVMANDYLWLPQCPAPKHDMLIVDESVIGKATEIISFDPTRITENDKWSGGPIEEEVDRREIARLVHAAITEHAGCELAYLRSNRVTGAEIKDCIRHLATREDALPAVSGWMTDRAISAALDAVESRETHKVWRLFRQIRRELPHPRRRLNSVWFEPDAMVKVGGQIERQPRVFVSYLKTPQVAAETPVLALDGTGSLALNRKIFGEHMTAERFPVPRDAEVIQVSSKTFSRQSITGTDRYGNPISAQKTAEAARLRQQVVELLDLLPGDVLLVTYKAAEEILLDDLPEHVVAAHFGALRGLNSFEHCETAVVMGREQPSAQAIEALTRPFTATDAEPFLPAGEYVLQSRGRRMRNGGANVVEVQVHPDPRCQALLEQVREAEIIQAVDRVRPVFNRRRIFVLTNLALDLTVDRALPWPELRPGIFAFAFVRYGVLPLSAGDLANVFRDLWASESIAKDSLKWWRQKTGGESQINKLFGGLPLFPRPLAATYRRKKQRGPAARALVRADLREPRHVVETLVGELVEFHVDRPPDPPQATATAPAPAAPRPLPALPPLAAALSAEGHLLATMPPDARPTDMLGMAGVMRLMALAGEAARAERTAAA